MRRAMVAALSIVATGAACTPPPPRPPAPPLAQWTSSAGLTFALAGAQALDESVDFCDRADDVARCAYARAELTTSLVDHLHELARSPDEDTIAAARAALETGEPEVQLAALELFAVRPAPDVDARVLPFLLGTRPALRAAAARALASSPIPSSSQLSRQYQVGHPEAPDPSPYARDEPVDDHALAVVGFAPWPEAARFPPGDSERSWGFLVRASVDDVAKTYARLAANTPMDFGAWLPHGDAPTWRGVPLPTAPWQLDRARFVAAEARNGAIVRVVVIYPESNLDRTVLIFAWDPSAYPGR